MDKDIIYIKYSNIEGFNITSELEYKKNVQDNFIQTKQAPVMYYYTHAIKSEYLHFIKVDSFFIHRLDFNSDSILKGLQEFIIFIIREEKLKGLLNEK